MMAPIDDFLADGVDVEKTSPTDAPHADSFENSRLIPGKEACHEVRLCHTQAYIETLIASPGALVARGDAILRLRRTVPDTHEYRQAYSHAEPDSLEGHLRVCDSIRAPVEGKLACEWSAGSIVHKDQVLFTVTETCGHAVQFNLLCALCGKSLANDQATGQDDTLRAQIVMMHDSMGVTVSEGVARNMDLETAERLKRERKLSLILDLDQTLVHASADPSVGAWMDAVTAERGEDCELLADLYRFFLDNNPLEYYLRLRPGLRDFLRRVQDLYELHIYTMGSRPYANKVAAIIDADGSIFKERVLSRDESGCQYRKSLNRLFPCDQSMVVVVDDRGDMWNWNDNLIRVHPYAYFVKSGDINAPPQDPSLPGAAVAAEMRKIASEDTGNNKLPIKLEDNDKELRILLTKLAELHEQFHRPASLGDVRRILPKMKAKVLKGCQIFFPDPEDQLKADAVPLALSFGAQCTPDMTSATTHVVSRINNSSAVTKAQRLGIPTVSYSWLFTSLSYWAKQPVKRFMLPPSPDKDLHEQTPDQHTDMKQDAVPQHVTEEDIALAKSRSDQPVDDLDELAKELNMLEQHEGEFGGAQDSCVLSALEDELREWMGDSFDQVLRSNSSGGKVEDDENGSDDEYCVNKTASTPDIKDKRKNQYADDCNDNQQVGTAKRQRIDEDGLYLPPGR